MKEQAKKAFDRSKKFVTDHKVGLTAIATFVATAYCIVKLQEADANVNAKVGQFNWREMSNYLEDNDLWADYQNYVSTTKS